MTTFQKLSNLFQFQRLAAERLAGLSTGDRLMGLKPEDVLSRFKPEERLRGLSLAEIEAVEAYLQQIKRNHSATPKH